MEQWILEHPWMTFFVLMTFASGFSFRFGFTRCCCKDKK